MISHTSQPLSRTTGQWERIRLYPRLLRRGALYRQHRRPTRQACQHGGSKAAEFTRDHAGGRLVYYEGPFEFAVALQRERQLKRWTRAKKLALIQNQILVLSRLSQSRETRR
jgi:putative endonuclease